MDELAAGVFRLRSRLVGCSLRCGGVLPRDPSKGDVPRVIHLERSVGVGSGVVVVGKNPGNADDDERDVIREQAESGDARIAKALYTHFERKILLGNRYYRHLRSAVRALGFDGPILWTEAVKCSSGLQAKLNVTSAPSIFATCGAKWLSRELALVPAVWPVVAVGRDAFVAVSFLAPARRVLGIPHATGSPLFWDVFDMGPGEMKLTPDVAEKLVPWRKREVRTLFVGG